jgi:histidinol dehydrogenase
MVEIIEYPSELAENRLSQIATRRVGVDPDLESQVLKILEAVKTRGDSALVDYTRQFDAPEFDSTKITVGQDEMEFAYGQVDTEFLDILKAAIANIEAFHRNQLRKSYFITRPDGTFLGQMVRPVASAGLYIPGGTGGETPLISSTLMNGIPACLAGVEDIALVTPPRRDGTVNPYLLVAAREVGVTRIHKVGSAWAIAALAYGTASVSRTDVIVGPGNVYVTLAKKLLAGHVGIDLLAGPSEILVIADSEANPDYLAADLLSQAEHDPMASAVLITTDIPVAEKTLKSLHNQTMQLPRNEIAREALLNYGAFFLVANLETAFDLSNRIAPEHLELQIRDPWAYLGKIAHAGAVFLGEHTPEAVGDYFAGSNHVLPTAGTARFASALGVENFLKRISVIAYSQSALQRDAPAILRLAEIEGLDAHAASVRIRLKESS